MCMAMGSGSLLSSHGSGIRAQRNEKGRSRSFSGCGRKPSFPSPSAGDLRELPGVPPRGEGSCGPTASATRRAASPRPARGQQPPPQPPASVTAAWRRQVPRPHVPRTLAAPCACVPATHVHQPPIASARQQVTCTHANCACVLVHRQPPTTALRWLPTCSRLVRYELAANCACLRGHRLPPSAPAPPPPTTRFPHVSA